MKGALERVMEARKQSEALEDVLLGIVNADGFRDLQALESVVVALSRVLDATFSLRLAEHFEEWTDQAMAGEACAEQEASERSPTQRSEARQAVGDVVS